LAEVFVLFIKIGMPVAAKEERKKLFSCPWLKSVFGTHNFRNIVVQNYKGMSSYYEALFAACWLWRLLRSVRLQNPRLRGRLPKEKAESRTLPSTVP